MGFRLEEFPGLEYRKKEFRTGFQKPAFRLFPDFARLSFSCPFSSFWSVLPWLVLPVFLLVLLPEFLLTVRPGFRLALQPAFVPVFRVAFLPEVQPCFRSGLE